MKYLSVLIFCILASSISYSQQLEIRVNELSEWDTSDRFKLRFTVINVGDSDLGFSWVYETLDNENQEWEITSVADQVVDYPSGVESSPCNLESYLEPQDSVFYFGMDISIDSENFEEACIKYCLIDTCFTEEHDTIICKNFKINREGVTQSQNITNNHSIMVYPNPSNNYIKLENDITVNSINIYTITGKIAMSIKHESGQLVDISKLPQGVYFVDFISKQGIRLQQIKLMKE